MSIVHMPSVSGGKDSLATLLVCVAENEGADIRPIFADTGNEHELTIEYVGYLNEKLHELFGLRITTIRADFSEWWWRRKTYIEENWHLPHKHYPDGVPPASIKRVLDVFSKGPTGNPFLDLCIIKGRFPSLMAQFCTQFLKREPIVEHQLSIIDQGNVVYSWQGVRADESAKRSHLKGHAKCCDKAFEPVGGGLFNVRPIIRWNALDCFEAAAYFGIKNNPLYKQGMGRVGCMPCINCSKAELKAIAARFPQHIDRIRDWESAVGLASKRGYSSFFPAPENGSANLKGRNIDEVVAWSKTARGGRQSMLSFDDDLAGCSSVYGLCEAGD